MWLQIHYLYALGGSDLGKIFRRMLRKLLDNTFLSQYSLQGIKGKKLFKELAPCIVVQIKCLIDT